MKTLGDLVNEYRKLAVKWGDLPPGDYKTGNRLQGKLMKLSSSIVAYGAQGEQELKNLMVDENPAVRMFAAADSKDFAPEQARAVLLYLVHFYSGAARGLMAQAILESMDQDKNG